MSGIGLGLMKPWQAALVGAQLLGIYLVMLILETSVARIEDPPSGTQDGSGGGGGGAAP
jgi:hypothetical protein